MRGKGTGEMRGTGRRMEGKGKERKEGRRKGGREGWGP